VSAVLEIFPDERNRASSTTDGPRVTPVQLPFLITRDTVRRSHQALLGGAAHLRQRILPVVQEAVNRVYELGGGVYGAGALLRDKLPVQVYLHGKLASRNLCA
jgi:hypothetical protein